MKHSHSITLLCLSLNTIAFLVILALLSPYANANQATTENIETTHPIELANSCTNIDHQVNASLDRMAVHMEEFSAGLKEISVGVKELLRREGL
ncbi:hypothetical protein [Vibrio owensii]|uniref:hypothetical protein n=1 Tax=Vibrio owensii TaxID=696485 RepID=UPI00148C07AC|nr:hypothetical protein [Vibrio owensii]NOI69611.1 hypothetical protein [Vibrio owensii]